MIQSKNKLIKEVVKIILKYSKPERIYLYGTQATGETNKGSDIDIAFDDKNFNNVYKIEEEINKLDTLIKIDVKNISKSDERFKNRVKATGKVLYSASKKLRAEDGFYNFKNALDKFIVVVDNENEYNEKGFGDIYLDIIVKRFEFTYEMAWKSLKRYLSYLGLEVSNPRNVFKEAYAQEIITDESIWLDMIEQRNLSAHIYNEFEIRELLEKKDNYKNAFEKLKRFFEKELLLHE